MAFKAAEVLDILDYDFRPYVDVKGTTPEPSPKKIRDFQHAIKASTGDLVIEQARLGEKDRLSAEDVAKAISDETDERAQAALDGILNAVAAVCSNKPTRAQLDKLPFRLQQHFVGYIMGKFLSGEASTLATRP